MRGMTRRKKSLWKAFCERLWDFFSQYSIRSFTWEMSVSLVSSPSQLLIWLLACARLQSQVHVKKEKEKKKAYRCSKFNAYYLLSSRGNSTLICLLCRPLCPCTRGNVNKTSMSILIYHTYDYRHAKFECHSLNIVRENTIIVQTFVTFETQLWPWVKVKGIGLGTI